MVAARRRCGGALTLRIAALADAHGNLPALRAVLADTRCQEADVVVVCGDVVAGPCPAETMDALLALGDRVRFLRGNADRHVLERLDETASWCCDRLGDDRATVVGGWPETLVLAVEGLGPVRFCHATPRSDEEIVTRITPVQAILKMLEGTIEPVVVGGHTHVQFDRRLDWRRLVNVGSVGWPYEGRPGAYWGLLGPDVELVRTQYDLTSASALLQASGYPFREGSAAERLAGATAEEATAHFESLRDP